MGPACGLFEGSYSVVRPIHGLEFGSARPREPAPKTAALADDGDRMPGDRVRLGPAVDDRHRPATPAVPVIEPALATPVAHTRHDEVILVEAGLVGGEHRLRGNWERLELAVRIINAQLRGESLRLVRPNRGGTEGMTPDVGPAQFIVINEVHPSDPRLSERDCHGGTDRTAP